MDCKLQTVIVYFLRLPLFFRSLSQNFEKKSNMCFKPSVQNIIQNKTRNLNVLELTFLTNEKVPSDDVIALYDCGKVINNELLMGYIANYT